MSDLVGNPEDRFSHNAALLVSFNVLRTIGGNKITFCIHIIIDKIYVRIVKRHFSQICNKVTMSEFVFAQYLENE